jgi:hypothetical protein
MWATGKAQARTPTLCHLAAACDCARTNLWALQRTRKHAASPPCQYGASSSQSSCSPQHPLLAGHSSIHPATVRDGCGMSQDSCGGRESAVHEGALHVQTGRGELTPLDASNASSVVRYGQRPGRLNQEAHGSVQASHLGPIPARARSGLAMFRPAWQGAPGEAGSVDAHSGPAALASRLLVALQGCGRARPAALCWRARRLCVRRVRATALRTRLPQELVRAERRACRLPSTHPAGGRLARGRSTAVLQRRCAQPESPPQTGGRLRRRRNARRRTTRSTPAATASGAGPRRSTTPRRCCTRPRCPTWTPPRATGTGWRATATRSAPSSAS